MKIRTLTYFLDPSFPIDDQTIYKAGDFIRYARTAFENAGYEVQTLRLATIPFPNLLPQISQGSLVDLAKNLESSASQAGFEYISIGPALPEFPHSYEHIPAALGETKAVFFSGSLSTRRMVISLSAAHACAGIIQSVSSITPDGFTNLRFAALANVPPGAPFFPAAYHAQSVEPSFAIGTEAADLAVQAVRSAGSLAECRDLLIKSIENTADGLNSTASGISAKYQLKFGGIDFTLAPFPELALSIGSAVEGLGVRNAGQHGTLAAVAFFTDCLQKANFNKAGFNGLFTPVLEDAVLAERAAQGILTLKDLLLYSAVCGTGLDTIPLPGDTSADQIYPVLIDLAALAHRLRKPLTARLMPLPGKTSGDRTGFDFPYFANSRVMSVESQELSGLLDKDSLMEIRGNN